MGETSVGCHPLGSRPLSVLGGLEREAYLATQRHVLEEDVFTRLRATLGLAAIVSIVR